MRTPPSSFVHALALVDPNLSVRWGDVLKQWIVESKAIIPTSELRYLTRRLARMERFAADPMHPQREQAAKLAKTIAEEVFCAKAGKRVICTTVSLNSQVFNAICAADSRRYGGYSRMADEMEKQEFIEAERTEKVLADQRNDLNREVYDQLNFLWRKRETALLAGERSMTKLLHGEAAAKKEKAKKRDTARAKQEIILTDL